MDQVAILKPYTTGSLQCGADDFAAELGLASLLFVHTVEHRTRIEPDGQAMQVFGWQLHVVMALDQQLIQSRGTGPELAGRCAVRPTTASP